jgi:hypothetical protein
MSSSRGLRKRTPLRFWFVTSIDRQPKPRRYWSATGVFQLGELCVFAR